MFKTFKKQAICRRAVPGHLACHISGKYMYIWQTYIPKTSLLIAFFQTEILSIFRTQTEIKLTYLEFWDETGSETHIFIRKYQFDNLALRDPRLTWPFSVVDLNGVRLLSGFDFLILRAKLTKNLVTHARKRIFDFGDILWPFLTWTWHWPILNDIYAHMVSSLALWGYFGWVSGKSYRYCRP